MDEALTVTWEAAGKTHSALWRSEANAPSPKRVVLADDNLNADAAYRLACEGTAMLYQGDFHNARQLLQALARRLERKPRRSGRMAPKPTPPITEAFHLHRQHQAQRARILGMLLLPLNDDYSVPLRRAPDVQQACIEAYGIPNNKNSVVSMRELLGLIGAHEWRKKGVYIPSINEYIHPHYGVFSPVRGEYIDLVAQAPLPTTILAFDIGTGTGVLATILARRGVAHIIATDQDTRALACAIENITRLGLSDQIEITRANLFPAGLAPLIVCNPPWLPAKPSSPIEYAIYDPENRMLLGFLNGLAAHLTPNGEGWLILSDFAEHLGLRTRDWLLSAIANAGLNILGRTEIAPLHPKSADTSDPLHAARAAERTSLWRLAAI